jgi:hypothetical protein
MLSQLRCAGVGRIQTPDNHDRQRQRNPLSSGNDERPAALRDTAVR